jgi:hypothetical protein
VGDKLLSVECSESREVVEIHLNRRGLESLIEVLSALRDACPPDHVHLMSAEWGGGELTGGPENAAFAAAKHLKICVW